MPKHKKKFKCERESIDDIDDNASVISSTATSSICQNDANSPERHDENVRDSISTKLDNAIEGIQEKGYKEREEALKHLMDLFKKHYLNEYLLDQKFTLTESLHKCLKRGKLNEQLLALKTIMLAFVQFGYTPESEEFLHLVFETLMSFIKNEQLEPELRGQCIKTLTLALYVTIQSDEMIALMDVLEQICRNADKMINKIQTSTTFYLAALSSWSLILTVMPINYVSNTLVDSLKRFEILLENVSDVEFRVCVGEAIALIYELIGGSREYISKLSSFDNSNLINVIDDLIKESSKSTSKKDRRTQHANFRDILRTIEDYTSKSNNLSDTSDNDLSDNNGLHQHTTGRSDKDFIKVGTQYLYLDNWLRKKQYKAFSDLLTTGMNIHLLENEFLRDVFDLGPPILVPVSHDKHNKLSKMQRVNRNKEEFRYRTKDMNKKRENKQQHVGNQVNHNDNYDDDDTYS